MKKQILAIFLVMLFVTTAYSQGYAPFEQIKKAIAQKNALQDSSLLNYLYPFFQALGSEAKYRQSMGADRYYQVMSAALASIGDYKKAIEYLKQSYDSLSVDEKDYITQQVGDISDIQSINATAFISGNANQSRVIMLNEAHDRPQHRVFAYSLLEDLYQQGFHYLAMETLNNFSSKSLQDVNVLTGKYTCEPVCGELVRKALELGYKLVAYEDTATSGHSPSQRDSVQAANIYRVIQQDKSAKMLVLAGYGHNAETMIGNEFKPMALWFKEISDIDPLTVNQTVFVEGSSFAFGSRYYDRLMKKITIDEPVVLLKNRKPFNLLEQQGFDIWVVHPPTIYADERPTWLAINGTRKPVSISPPERNAFLMQAFYKKEYDAYRLDAAVPADQTYIRTQYGYFPLYLRPGTYEIVLRDAGYNVISVKERVVE